MEKKNKNSEKHTTILLLIVLLLVIIVFLLAKFLGMIDHKPLIPTGNIDIFDINFIKENNCQCICNNGNNTNSGGNNGSAISSGCTSCETSEPDHEMQPGIETVEGVHVYDNKTLYSTNTPLNIFTQPAYYVANNHIAPASENFYQFVIRNNTDFNIEYSLEMTETNEYNINMKYRLKINGIYVAGDDKEYVSIDEINQYDIGLASRDYNVYTLDWKWFESNNDTEVGTNINSKYKLDLTITASEY